MLLFICFSEAVYSTIKLEYDENGKLCNNEAKCQPDEIETTIDQTLWPDHCVKNTQGAKVSTKLNKTSGDIIIRKGFNCDVMLNPLDKLKPNR